MTFSGSCIILRYVIEAWLSLVERCVRDAEVACSNHVASILTWPVGQAAKTTPSHGVNPGSIPGQVIEAVTEYSVTAFFILYLSQETAQTPVDRRRPGRHIRRPAVCTAAIRVRPLRRIIIHAGAWRMNPYRNSSDFHKRLCRLPRRSAYPLTFWPPARSCACWGRRHSRRRRPFLL